MTLSESILCCQYYLPCSGTLDPQLASYITMVQNGRGAHFRGQGLRMAFERRTSHTVDAKFVGELEGNQSGNVWIMCETDPFETLNVLPF